MKLKLFLAALAAATPVAANAYGQAGTFVPEQISLDSDGLYIYGGATYANPDGCASNTYIKIVGASPEELERMYSMLLTSIASGKSVTVWVNGCVNSVWGMTVPKGYHITLLR